MKDIISRYSTRSWCCMISLLILITIISIFQSQELVVEAGIPRFAILQETNEIIYISTTLKAYKKFPDNFTLTYISNGLTPERLSSIPLKALTEYREEAIQTSSTLLRHWDDATDRISAKLKVIQDDPSLLNNQVIIGGFCNPALIYFKERYLVASRKPDWSPVIVFSWLKQKAQSSSSGSFNSADLVIDETSSYLGIGPGMTELQGVSGFSSSGEDPRLLKINENVIIMIRTDVESQPTRLKIAYFQFEESSSSGSSSPHFTLVNDTVLQPPHYEQTKEHAQKNWSPFLSLSNELQFVYMIQDNFIVVRPNPERPSHMEIVSEVPNYGKVTNLWQYGPVRGGSPARRIGKTRYLSFFHSQMPTPNTGANWHSAYIGAYLFTGSEPYQLLAMSRVPLVHDSWYQGAWLNVFQTLYLYFASSFYFIELKTNNILEYIDLDVCESRNCLLQYNVTLSYGFNNRVGYVTSMNLASLLETMHFFDSGDILTLYTDIEDIYESPDHYKKQCAVEEADFESDYNPLDHGYKFFNVSSSSNIHFQIALQPHQLFDKTKTKQHRSHSTGGKSEEVMQWIADHTVMWKIIDWHFQVIHKMKGISTTLQSGEMIRCLDIGAKSGFYSLLMAQYRCVVDLFESKQSIVESLKVSVCLNYLHDYMVIHRTALGSGKAGNSGDVQSFEMKRLPAADDCLFLNNAYKNFALIRIDMDGMEVHTLQGLQSTLNQGIVDAIILELYPGSWEKSGLTLDKGVNSIQSILGKKFTPHIVVGSELCPLEVLSVSSKGDLQIDKHVTMKPLSWNTFSEVLEKVKVHRYYCNFLFFHNIKSLSKRLEIVPFVSS